jgi:hypothetical protein
MASLREIVCSFSFHRILVCEQLAVTEKKNSVHCRDAHRIHQNHDDCEGEERLEITRKMKILAVSTQHFLDTWYLREWQSTE